jgi:dephospho-CoA kinase
MGTKKGAVKHPFVIALTGGIASGKSTVSRLFGELYGVCVVDADVIAREVVAIGEPALQALAEHFGQAVLLPDGSLNRAYLRNCIFGNSSEREWVNALLHPLIHQRMTDQLLSCRSDYALVVIPLLVETGVPEYVDFVFVVDCDEQQQYQRLLTRHGVTITLAQSMIAAQATRAARLAIADGVIQNDQGLQYLEQAVVQWHHHFLTLVEQ